MALAQLKPIASNYFHTLTTELQHKTYNQIIKKIY
jgi:hypothetical protein